MILKCIMCGGEVCPTMPDDDMAICRACEYYSSLPCPPM
jgi:hypothetical protein